MKNRAQYIIKIAAVIIAALLVISMILPFIGVWN